MTDKLLIDRELLTDLRDAASECLDREDRQRRQMIYSRLVSDSDAILAQSAPEPVQGEAVEVVSVQHRRPVVIDRSGEASGYSDWKHGDGLAYWPKRELMTVAQHERILAAATRPADQVAEGVVVSRELLENCTNYMMGSASARVRIWHDQCRALLASAGQEVEK